MEIDAGASRAALCCSTEPRPNVQPAASAAITGTANTWGALPCSSLLCLPCQSEEATPTHDPAAGVRLVVVLRRGVRLAVSRSARGSAPSFPFPAPTGRAGPPSHL